MVDSKQLRELVTSRWVTNGDSVSVLKPPGVGETRFSAAFCRETIARLSTLFVPATRLVTQLAPAHAEGRLGDKLIHWTKPERL